MLQFFCRKSDSAVFLLKLIVVCNVIAIPCLHEMKEGEIQREELIPPMFHCSEKKMETPGNPVRFVELSLSYPSQQITMSHCLHTLRDNNVGTLDFISYLCATHSQRYTQEK